MIVTNVSLRQKTNGREKLISLPPLRLCVNEFCVYNFCCFLTNIIHPTNPFHLIVSFEFFGYTFTRYHFLRYEFGDYQLDFYFYDNLLITTVISYTSNWKL